jgi:YD repeat-containing protein
MDVQGRTVALRDASIQNGDELGRIVETFDYDMLGRVLRTQNMETGRNWAIHNIFGDTLMAWNEEGLKVRSRYDDASRLISTSITGDALNAGGLDSEVQVTRTIFGEMHPEAETRNLRGRSWLDLDQAGLVTVEHLDFKGNVLDSTQRISKEYKKNIDWSTVESVISTSPGSRIELNTLEAILTEHLQDETFLDQSSFDAMNRILVATLAHSKTNLNPAEIRMTYDLTNLVKIDCNVQGEMNNDQKLWTAFVTDIQYQPDGKRTSIQYANSVATTYTYDAEHKLRRQLTTRGIGGQSDNLQDLQFTYDPTGNITTLMDNALQTVYFRNTIVEPRQDFTYDSLNQLVEATGREHLGQPRSVPIPYGFSDGERSGPNPGDESAMGLYREQYEYDAVGNMLSMRHGSSNQIQDTGNKTWIRTFSYEVPSKIEPLKSCNQLKRCSLGNGSLTEEFMQDVHGNTIRLPHLGGQPRTPNVTWDFLDRLKALDLGGGGNAYYSYAASDKLVRKVIEKTANLSEERLYLRGIEIFRQRNAAGDVLFERETACSRRQEENRHAGDSQQRHSRNRSCSTTANTISIGVAPRFCNNRIG